MHPPRTACPEATDIMQRMWTDGVSHLDWVLPEDQCEVNRRHETQRGFTTPAFAREAAALAKNGTRSAEVTVLDPTIGTGVLAGSLIATLAELPPPERPQTITVIGIERNHHYCAAARTWLSKLAAWAAQRNVRVRTHVVNGDFLNPASWTGPVQGAAHDDIDADIVMINPPHRPTRSKTDEGRRIQELKLLPSTTTETAYIDLAARTLADGGEMIALSSAKWLNDDDYGRALRRLQKNGSITDIHLYRRHTISSARIFGRNAQHMDTTVWRYEKGAANKPTTNVFHETNGPGEKGGATISVVRPHADVLPMTDIRGHRSTIELPRSRLDDEILRILRGLPKLKNTGLAVLRGRLSPYLDRRRFTRDGGEGAVALITANNIVQAEGPAWRLEWPSPRPNSLQYYHPDRDKTAVPALPPGDYVFITGPAGNGHEPCPRAAHAYRDRVPIPFTVTQQVQVIGARQQNGGTTNVGPLEHDHARGLTAWLNSRLIRTHFRMNVKCGHVTSLHAGRIPTPEKALLKEIARLEDDIGDAAAMTAIQSRLTSTETQALRHMERIEEAWETVLQKLGAGPRVANYAAATAIAAMAVHQETGHHDVSIGDLLPLIRKTFDIDFNGESGKWLENVLVPWSTDAGAMRVSADGRVQLTDRMMHWLVTPAVAERRACA